MLENHCNNFFKSLVKLKSVNSSYFIFMLRILVTELHGVLMSEADDVLFFHRILEKEVLSSFYTANLTSSYIVFNAVSDKEV